MNVIKKYKKFSLVFDEYSEKFEAQDQEGKTITTSSSFSGLKANVDAYIKRQRKLKPFEIIQRERDRVVKLSSIASEDFDEIWISWKDENEPRRSRSKEQLIYRWMPDQDPYFVLASPENLEILRKIQKAQKSIDQIETHIEKLRLTYTDPITDEVLKKMVN